MKFLKRWIRNWLDSDDHNKVAGISKGLAVTASDSGFHDNDSLRFTVTPARGGIIMCIRHYDQRTGDSKYVNHVLHEDGEVAENIAQIVTMELLRS